MAKLPFLIVLYAYLHIQCEALPSQIRSNVSCNEIISDTFINESHYHQLVINSSYEIHFEDCNHDNINATLTILDEFEKVASNAYCSDSNECGNCWVYFSVPLNKGTYFLKIEPYINGKGGSYELKIDCSSNCDYYVAENDMISISHRMFESVTIIDDKIEIEFDIKINEDCNASICNILYLGNTPYISYPSLSINGQDNYFNISLRDQTQWHEFYEPNAKQILSTNNSFQHIYLSIKPKEKVFMIDDIVYGSAIRAVPSQITPFFLSELQEMNENNVNVSTIWHPSYPFFMSNPWNNDTNFNATIKNLCIRSAPQIVDTMRCNSKLNVIGDILIGDIKYYKVVLLKNTYYLTFNLISLYFRYVFSFRLYDNVFNVVYQVQSQQYTLRAMGDIVINSLDAGEYLVRLEFTEQGSFVSDNWFTVPLYCIFKSNTDRYVFTPDVSGEMSWPAAQWHCEHRYGSTLATMASPQEIEQAVQVMNQSTLLFSQGGWDDTYWVNINNLWIGMYKTLDSNWQWVDGTACSYNGTGYCIDDQSPYHDSLRMCPVQCYSERMVDGPPSMNATVAAYIWRRVLEWDTIPHAILQDSIDRPGDGFLCNAPHDGYSAHYCNDTVNCWKYMECCNNSILNEDIVFEYHDTQYDPHEELCDVGDYYAVHNDYSTFGTAQFTPPIAFWDSTLFVFGANTLHFTDFALFGSEFNWKHLSYDDFAGTEYLSFSQIIMKSQRYAQYQSSFFLYNAAQDLIGGDRLIHIDLSNATLKYEFIEASDYSSNPGHFVKYQCPVVSPYTVGSNEYIENKCMVANGEYVYIINQASLLMFSFATKEWSSASTIKSSEVELDALIACAIANGDNIIYLLAYASFSSTCDLLKYEVETSEISKVGSLGMCFTELYSEWSPRSITARNDKIYIHGVAATSWSTVIFDTKTEQFETRKMRIDVPTRSDIYGYRQSQLAVFDDNVLILFYINREEQIGNVYYAITNRISLNFTQTISAVWPSDGFFLKYYANDFSSLPSGIFPIWLYCGNTISDINASLTLNASNDECICNQSSYNCFNCKQYFNLSQYLTLADNGIDELHFFPQLQYGVVAVDDDTLIRPEYITIELNRCRISFENLNQVSYSDALLIRYSYHLSQSCYLRKGSFSMDITSLSLAANINKELIITILDVGNGQNTTQVTELCTICDVGDCFDCNDISGEIGWFQFQHQMVNNEESMLFEVLFESKMIDLAIDSSSNSFKMTYVPKTASDNLTAPLSIAGAALFLGILGITGFCYRKNKKLQDEVRKQRQYEHKLENPMFISIGIAFYKSEVTNPGFSGHCSDLNGIDRDYENIKRFCDAFNYDLFPKIEQYEWTQKEIIEEIEKDVIAFEANRKSEQNPNGYDSIVTIISGHGYKSSIIASDYHLVSKLAIHRLYSINHAAVRTYPRIFLFDCCDGIQERSDSPAHSQDYDAGKNFDIDDIKIDVVDEEIWKSNQVNPDFKVALIHAANDGFQSKMNNIDGSYLIYEFIKRMFQNTQDKEDKFLGDIIDEIQQYLHDKGKQQTKSVFNNNTRYLKFEINTNAKKEEFEEQKEEEKANDASDEGQSSRLLEVNEMELTEVTGDQLDDIMVHKKIRII